MKNKNVLLGLISFSLMMVLSAGFAFAEVSFSSVFAPLKNLSVGILEPFGLDSLEGLIIMITFALMIGGFLEVLKIFDKNTKVIWGIGLGGSLILMYNLVAFNLLGALLSLGLIGMLIFLFAGILVSAYGWWKKHEKAADIAGFDQKVNREQQKINRKDMTEIKSELDLIIDDENALTKIYNLAAMFLAESQAQPETAFTESPAKDRLDAIKALAQDKNGKGGIRNINDTDRANLHKLFKDAVNAKNVGMIGAFLNEVKRVHERISLMRKSLETVQTKVVKQNTAEKATEYISNM